MVTLVAMVILAVYCYSKCDGDVLMVTVTSVVISDVNTDGDGDIGVKVILKVMEKLMVIVMILW